MIGRIELALFVGALGLLLGVLFAQALQPDHEFEAFKGWCTAEGGFIAVAQDEVLCIRDHQVIGRYL